VGIVESPPSVDAAAKQYPTVLPGPALAVSILDSLVQAGTCAVARKPHTQLPCALTSMGMQSAGGFGVDQSWQQACGSAPTTEMTLSMCKHWLSVGTKLDPELVTPSVKVQVLLMGMHDLAGTITMSLLCVSPIEVVCAARWSYSCPAEVACPCTARAGWNEFALSQRTLIGLHQC
jgi:hypothetical protein